MSMTRTPSVSVSVWPAEESHIAHTLWDWDYALFYFCTAPNPTRPCICNGSLPGTMVKVIINTSILILALLAFHLPALFVIPGRPKAFFPHGEEHCHNDVEALSGLTFGRTVTSETRTLSFTTSFVTSDDLF